MDKYINRLLILDSLDIKIDVEVKRLYTFLENSTYKIDSYDEPYDKVNYYIKINGFVEFIVCTYMYMNPDLNITEDFYKRFDLDNKLIHSIVKYFLKEKYKNIDHIKYIS